MYSHWQPTTGASHPGLPTQPIQPWQLADARHAADAAEARLAAAEHAFAREKEQYLTTIAALEHSAKVRESTIEELRAKVELRNRDCESIRVQAKFAIDEAERNAKEISDEYTQETRRMREAVANHQRTAADREKSFSEIVAKLQRSDSALSQAKEQNDELALRIEKLTRTREAESIDGRSKLESLQAKLTESEEEVARLRHLLDETETQHKSDVETLGHEVAELKSTIVAQDRTLEDLDQLCDQRAAERDDALEIARYVQESLDSKQTELDEVVALAESVDAQLSDAVSIHRSELERVENSLSEKVNEVDSRKAEMRELAATLVQRETEFKTQLERLEQTHREKEAATLESRRAELRELANNLVRRENEYRSSLENAKSANEAERTRLESRVAELSELADNLTERERESRLQLESVSSEIDAEKTQLESRVSELTESLQHLQQSNEEASESRRAEMRELANNLVRRENEYKAALAEAKQATESQASETTALHQQEIAQLQQSVHRATTERDSMVLAMNDQISQLNLNHNDALARIAEERFSQVEAYEAQIESLSDSLRDVESNLAAQADEWNAREERYKQHLAQLQDQMRQVSEEHQSQIASVQMQQTQVRPEDAEQLRLLEEQVANLRSSQAQMESEQANLQSERTRLQSEHANMQSEYSQAIEAQRRELESIHEQHASELSNHLAQIQRLTEQLRVASTQHESLKAEKFAAQAEDSAAVSQRLEELQAANQRLKQAVAEKEHAIDARTQELRLLQKRVSDLEAAQKNVTAPKGVSGESKYRQQIAKLRALYAEQLEKCQRAEFAVTQLDRTVVWLEKTSSGLQEDLQREAAARRKAESALKQRAGQDDADRVTQALSTQIEMDEQIKRLTRELDATQKIRLIERQQADAELKKIRRELAIASGKNRSQKAA